MKKKWIVCGLAALIVSSTSLTPAAQAAEMTAQQAYDMAIRFEDVKTNGWYFEDVVDMITRGTMKGRSSSKFDPNGVLTNAEVAQILYNLNVQNPTGAEPEFLDVPSNAWYYNAVMACGGCFPEHWNRYQGGADFRPNTAISRSELSYTLLRSSGMEDDDIFASCHNVTGLYSAGGSFKSTILAASFDVMVERGLISGYGNGEYGMDDSLTRAQCAAILHRMLQADSEGSTSSAVQGTRYYADMVEYAPNVTQMTCAEDKTLYYVSENCLYHTDASNTSYLILDGNAMSMTADTDVILQQKETHIGHCDISVKKIKDKLDEDRQVTFSGFTIAGAVFDHTDGRTYALAWSEIDCYDHYDSLFTMILIDLDNPEQVVAQIFTADSRPWDMVGMPNSCSILKEGSRLIYGSGFTADRYSTSYAQTLQWNLDLGTVTMYVYSGMYKCSASIVDHDVWLLGTRFDSELCTFGMNLETPRSISLRPAGWNVCDAGAWEGDFYFIAEDESNDNKMTLYHISVPFSKDITTTPKKLTALEDIVANDHLPIPNFMFQRSNLWAADSDGVLYFWDCGNDLIRQIYCA